MAFVRVYLDPILGINILSTGSIRDGLSEAWRITARKHMGAFFVLLSVVVPSLIGAVAAAAIIVVIRSVTVIGPAQIGLVAKRFSRRHNTTDTPIAFDGEAGYQSDLLMPGVRFKLWPTYTVSPL